jgi:hypothetical protein
VPRTNLPRARRSKLHRFYTDTVYSHSISSPSWSKNDTSGHPLPGRRQSRGESSTRLLFNPYMIRSRELNSWRNQRVHSGLASLKSLFLPKATHSTRPTCDYFTNHKTHRTRLDVQLRIDASATMKRPSGREIAHNQSMCAPIRTALGGTSSANIRRSGADRAGESRPRPD